MKISGFHIMIKFCHEFDTFCDVQIEEVTVEDSLDASGDHGDQVEESLGVVAVDPVEYVQRPVAAEGKQVVAGDRLGLARLADHKQLGQDCNRLQVDRERPQYLHHHQEYIKSN